MITPNLQSALSSGGDGNRTPDLQTAIDAVHARGGGRVDVPPGRHRVGSLELKSGVELFLEAGATLVGSTERTDYGEDSILWAKDARDIALSGRGRIEGAGSAFADKKGFRPHNIHFQRCRGVRITDVQLTKSSSWMQRYFLCDDIFVRGIRVFNFDNYNADGIDFVSCRNVTMSDCVIHSDDDAFCLKTVTDDPCENITVTNCVFGSHCNAIKIGTESYGDFRNITISNCVVAPPPCDTVWYGSPEGRGGIDLGVVDGAVLENILLSHISIRGTLSPIFLRLGARSRPYGNDRSKPPGALRNVLISNINAVEAGCLGCEITGLPDFPVENITLDTIRVTYRGGGPVEPWTVSAMPVPEYPDKYPNPGMHGALPAYGFFFRHINGLTARNLELRCERPEARPAVLMDNVTDVRLFDLKADAPDGVGPVVRLERARLVRIDRMVSVPSMRDPVLITDGCEIVPCHDEPTPNRDALAIPSKDSNPTKNPL